MSITGSQESPSVKEGGGQVSNRAKDVPIR